MSLINNTDCGILGLDWNFTFFLFGHVLSFSVLPKSLIRGSRQNIGCKIIVTSTTISATWGIVEVGKSGKPDPKARRGGGMVKTALRSFRYTCSKLAPSTNGARSCKSSLSSRISRCLTIFTRKLRFLFPLSSVQRRRRRFSEDRSFVLFRS